MLGSRLATQEGNGRGRIGKAVLVDDDLKDAEGFPDSSVDYRLRCPDLCLNGSLEVCTILVRKQRSQIVFLVI